MRRISLLSALFLGGCGSFDLFGEWTDTAECENGAGPEVDLRVVEGGPLGAIGYVDLGTSSGCSMGAVDLDPDQDYFNIFVTQNCAEGRTEYDLDLNVAWVFGWGLQGTVAWDYEICSMRLHRPDSENVFME